ncbi:MAG TPA: NADP-dependent isocitrate dehydrogenase [Anaerolineae bacterium]|nr:NADP-dependent isocitrate dehydrogenase [Anaerolineae bacterium]
MDMNNSRKMITIPYIIGDGIGPDIWKAAQIVLNTAIEKAYHGKSQVQWLEVLAGEKAFQKVGKYLPDETLETLRKYKVGIKGPLTTPVGGGFQSLNVILRKELDLYACQRPVHWFKGLPSPLINPQGLDVVLLRENTEDVYSGIEFGANSSKNLLLLKILKNKFPSKFQCLRFTKEVGIDLKPISKEGSQRLVRAAVKWAIENKRNKVTLIHKGNIMKYTEGAFLQWGYQLIEEEFPDYAYTQQQWQQTKNAYGENNANREKDMALQSGKILINDMIADVAFEQAISQPTSFDVIAATNLNGDYLSDAFAALAGGVGISPGGNINYETGMALFEANHGSAVSLANQNKANPSSLILSGSMMFRFLSLTEAANLIIRGIKATIRRGEVTFDLYSQITGNTLLGTQEFAEAVSASID